MERRVDRYSGTSVHVVRTHAEVLVDRDDVLADGVVVHPTRTHGEVVLRTSAEESSLLWMASRMLGNPVQGLRIVHWVGRFVRSSKVIVRIRVHAYNTVAIPARVPRGR